MRVSNNRPSDSKLQKLALFHHIVSLNSLKSLLICSLFLLYRSPIIYFTPTNKRAAQGGLASRNGWSSSWTNRRPPKPVIHSSPSLWHDLWSIKSPPDDTNRYVIPYKLLTEHFSRTALHSLLERYILFQWETPSPFKQNRRITHTIS